MTFTRSMDEHQYRPAGYPMQDSPGFIRQSTVNNIMQTWAVARPVNAPTPIYNPPAQVPRSQDGVDEFAFTPPVYRVEMDPKNPETWQRQYRFT